MAWKAKPEGFGKIAFKDNNSMKGSPFFGDNLGGANPVGGVRITRICPVQLPTMRPFHVCCYVVDFANQMATPEGYHRSGLGCGLCHKLCGGYPDPGVICKFLVCQVA